MNCVIFVVLGAGTNQNYRFILTRVVNKESWKLLIVIKERAIAYASRFRFFLGSLLVGVKIHLWFFIFLSS